MALVMRLNCQIFLKSPLLNLLVGFALSWNKGIVDLPFRITTCRFLLAIVFRMWGLVCINYTVALNA